MLWRKPSTDLIEGFEQLKGVELSYVDSKSKEIMLLGDTNYKYKKKEIKTFLENLI